MVRHNVSSVFRPSLCNTTVVFVGTVTLAEAGLKGFSGLSGKLQMLEGFLIVFFYFSRLPICFLTL